MLNKEPYDELLIRRNRSHKQEVQTQKIMHNPQHVVSTKGCTLSDNEMNTHLQEQKLGECKVKPCFYAGSAAGHNKDK